MQSQQQKQVELNPETALQYLNQIKSQITSNNGQINQGLSDNNTVWYSESTKLVQQIFQLKAQTDSELVRVKAELEKVYNAHPELKINNESDKKKK